MKFNLKKSISILGLAGLLAASLAGCGGGGGSTAGERAVTSSFEAPVTSSTVEAIVGEEFTFSSGIQAVDKVSGESISIPATTLTISRSAESPTGYAFTMTPRDGTGEVSGSFGFGSCIFTVVKSTAVWPKKNEGEPDILIEGEQVTIDACEINLEGGYTVTDEEAFEAEIMLLLGESITDPAQTPVIIIPKEDKGTVIINGQNVGDTRLEFVTGGA